MLNLNLQKQKKAIWNWVYLPIQALKKSYYEKYTTLSKYNSKLLRNSKFIQFQEQKIKQFLPDEYPNILNNSDSGLQINESTHDSRRVSILLLIYIQDGIILHLIKIQEPEFLYL